MFPLVERCVLQVVREEDYNALSTEASHKIKEEIVQNNTTLELGQVLPASATLPSFTVVDLSPTTTVSTSPAKAATFIILPLFAPTTDERRAAAEDHVDKLAETISSGDTVHGCTQDIENFVTVTCVPASALPDCALANAAFMEQLFLSDYSLLALGSEEYLTHFLVKLGEAPSTVVAAPNESRSGGMRLSVPASLFQNIRAAYCATEVCLNEQFDFSSLSICIPVDSFTPTQDVNGNLVRLVPHERHKESVLSAVKLVPVYSEFVLRHLFGDSFFDLLALALQVGTADLHGKLVSVGDVLLVHVDKASLQQPTATMSDAVDRFECVMRVYLHQQEEYARLWGNSASRSAITLPFRVAEAVVNGSTVTASGTGDRGFLPYGFLYSIEESSLGPTEVHLIPASASCLTLLDQTPVGHPKGKGLLAELAFCKALATAAQQCISDSLGAGEEDAVQCNAANLLVIHGGKENAAFCLVEEVLSWFGIPVLTISAASVEGEEVEVILNKLFLEATPTVLLVGHADQMLARAPHFFSLLESAYQGQAAVAELGASAAASAHLICFVCENVEEPSPLLTAHSRYPVLSCGNPDQDDRAVFAHFTVQDLCKAYPIVPSRYMDYDVVSSWMVGLSYSDIRNILHSSVHSLLKDCAETNASTTAPSYKYVLTMESCQEELNAYIKAHGYSVVSTKLQPVRWSDVGGLEEAKQELKEAIQLPTLYPELFARSGMKKRSGILFYGPPGCGKTLLAKAVATEMNMNFMSVKGPELINQYVGESEKQIRQLFQKARDNAPCIIFFDELDALAPARGAKGDGGGAMDRIVAQLLVEVDGVGQQAPASNGGTGASPTIFIIGATNRPDLLDSALLRPGRFDRLCYLGIPATNEEQLYAVKALTRKFSLGKDVDLGAIVQQMDFVYTGADFFALCSDAMMMAVEEKLEEAKAGLVAAVPEAGNKTMANPADSVHPAEGEASKDEFIVSMKHFLKSLDQLKPSVSPDDLKRYELLRKKFSA